MEAPLFCRHDRNIDVGCRECLGPDDWHVEEPKMTLTKDEAETIFAKLAADAVDGDTVVAIVSGVDGDTVDVCVCDDDDTVEQRTSLLIDLYVGDASCVALLTVRTGSGQRPADFERLTRTAEHATSAGLPLVGWYQIDADGSRWLS